MRFFLKFLAGEDLAEQMKKYLDQNPKKITLVIVCIRNISDVIRQKCVEKFGNRIYK